MRQLWQLWEGALSPEECKQYTELCIQTCKLQDGTTFNSNSTVRKTKIGWTHNPLLVKLAKNYAYAANRAAFGFNVNYIPTIQFGEYSKGSFYDWHHDIDWTANMSYDRKLSVVVQLSNSNNYSGGQLEFKETEAPSQFSTQGSIIVFPSYLQHRVTEVSEGVRYSLVCWAEGPRWV